MPSILGSMLPTSTIAEQIAKKRKALGLSQTALAKKGTRRPIHLGRPRKRSYGRVGDTKIVNILTSRGLELRLQEASYRRLTLKDLLREASDDSSLN